MQQQASSSQKNLVKKVAGDRKVSGARTKTRPSHGSQKTKAIDIMQEYQLSQAHNQFKPQMQSTLNPSQHPFFEYTTKQQKQAKAADQPLMNPVSSSTYYTYSNALRKAKDGNSSGDESRNTTHEFRRKWHGSSAKSSNKSRSSSKSAISKHSKDNISSFNTNPEITTQDKVKEKKSRVDSKGRSERKQTKLEAKPTDPVQSLQGNKIVYGEQIANKLKSDTKQRRSNSNDFRVNSVGQVDMHQSAKVTQKTQSRKELATVNNWASTLPPQAPNQRLEKMQPQQAMQGKKEERQRSKKRVQKARTQMKNMNTLVSAQSGQNLQKMASGLLSQQNPTFKASRGSTQSQSKLSSNYMSEMVVGAREQPVNLEPTAQDQPTDNPLKIKDSLKKVSNSPVKRSNKVAHTPTNAATFDKLHKNTGSYATASHEKRLERDRDHGPTPITTSSQKLKEPSEARFRDKSERRPRDKSQKNQQQKSDRTANPKANIEGLIQNKEVKRNRSKSIKDKFLVANQNNNGQSSSPAEEQPRKRKDLKRKKSTTRRKSTKRGGSCEKVKEEDDVRSRSPIKDRQANQVRSTSQGNRNLGQTYSQYRLRMYKPKKAKLQGIEKIGREDIVFQDTRQNTLSQPQLPSASHSTISHEKSNRIDTSKERQRKRIILTNAEKQVGGKPKAIKRLIPPKKISEKKKSTKTVNLMQPLKPKGPVIKVENVEKLQNSRSGQDTQQKLLQTPQRRDKAEPDMQKVLQSSASGVEGEKLSNGSSPKFQISLKQLEQLLMSSQNAQPISQQLKQNKLKRLKIKKIDQSTNSSQDQFIQINPNCNVFSTSLDKKLGDKSSSHLASPIQSQNKTSVSPHNLKNVKLEQFTSTIPRTNLQPIFTPVNNHLGMTVQKVSSERGLVKKIQSQLLVKDPQQSGLLSLVQLQKLRSKRMQSMKQRADHLRLKTQAAIKIQRHLRSFLAKRKAAEEQMRQINQDNNPPSRGEIEYLLERRTPQEIEKLMEIKTPKQQKEQPIEDQVPQIPLLNQVPSIVSSNGNRALVEEEKGPNLEQQELNGKLSRQSRDQYIDSQVDQFEDSKVNLREGTYLYNLKEKQNESANDISNNVDESYRSYKQPSLRQIGSSLTSRSTKMRQNGQYPSDNRISQDPNLSITQSKILLETSIQQCESKEEIRSANRVVNGRTLLQESDIDALNRAPDNQGQDVRPVVLTPKVHHNTTLTNNLQNDPSKLSLYDERWPRSRERSTRSLHSANQIMAQSPSGSINQPSIQKTSEAVSSVASNLVINRQLTEEMPHSSRGLSSPDRRGNRARNQLGAAEIGNIHDNSSSFKNEDSNKSGENSYEEAPYEKSNHDMNLILFQGTTENLTQDQLPLFRNIDFQESSVAPPQSSDRNNQIRGMLEQKYDQLIDEYNMGMRADQQAFIERVNSIGTSQLGNLFLEGKNQFLEAIREAENLANLLDIFKAQGAQGIHEQNSSQRPQHAQELEERKVANDNEHSMIQSLPENTSSTPLASNDQQADLPQTQPVGEKREQQEAPKVSSGSDFAPSSPSPQTSLSPKPQNPKTPQVLFENVCYKF